MDGACRSQARWPADGATRLACLPMQFNASRSAPALFARETNFGPSNSFLVFALMASPKTRIIMVTGTPEAMPMSMDELLKDRCFRECQARAIAAYYVRTDHDEEEVKTHFQAEGVPRRRILEIIKRFQRNGSVELGKTSGRKPSATSSENVDAVRMLFDTEPEISIPEASRRLNLTTSSIRRILTEKLDRTKVKRDGNKFVYVPSSKDLLRNAKRSVCKQAKRTNFSNSSFIEIQNQCELPTDAQNVTTLAHGSQRSLSCTIDQAEIIIPSALN